MKRIDETVKEIWGILLVYGVLVQIVGIWFVSHKLAYSVGLWMGILLAMFMIWHMHRHLSRALELDEKNAVKQSAKGYAIRLLVICAVILGVYIFRIGNVVMTFIGVFGLKIAAYLQPFLHQKLELRKKGA